MPPAAPCFTAARIAAALGITPQAVRQQLRDVKPSARVLAGGQLADAWTFAEMTPRLRDTIASKAVALGYRNAEAMLLEPPTRWQPEIPLREWSAESIEHATKLQRALTPSLLRQHDPVLSRVDFERQGVADYAREFGNTISDRYFRELIARVRERDAGAEDWARLEIFAPLRITPKKQPARKIMPSAAEDFADLVSFVASCVNPSKPNETEQRGIWTLAFQHFDRLVAQGRDAKFAARRLRNFLFAQVPSLAPTREALCVAFNRKLARWHESGRDAKALRDRREENGNAFDLPDNDLDWLVHRAVFMYRGDVASAWRDGMSGDFSRATREHYTNAPRRKSYVPAKVMELARPEVEIFTVMHQGPRAFDSIKGHVRRCYDGISSLQAMSADDFTFPVYFYVPDGKGGFTLTRGQCLIFIDFRTLNVIGFSLEPNRNYSSLSIRSLCTHVFSEFVVPEILYFERGIWKSASLLKGQQGAFGVAEISQGLREFGIRFIHANRPRSKAVERVGGLLQDLMEAEPGYCGRDERRDAPEALRKQMARVASGEHPSKWFYSYEQWNARLQKIIEQYNTTPQQGRILDGLSPDEALQKFLNWENPPFQFWPQLRALLAHDKRQVRVTLDGITIRIGKKRFTYRGLPLARFVGHDVLAWFDPENPDVLAVTDLNRENAVCVPRAEDVSALECLTQTDSEPLSRALQRVEEQASHMRTRFTMLKKKFPLPQRALLLDAQAAQTIATCEEIESGKRAVRAERAEHNRLAARAEKLSRKIGVPVSPESLRDVPAEDDAFMAKYYEGETT